MSGLLNNIPLGVPGEFERTCLPDRGEPVEPDPVTKKIFDDMRGDDAEQKPVSPSHKGDFKS